MQTQRIKLADLAPNKGQIPGLPSNPRQWTRAEIDKIAKSLKETPELFEARPIIVTPWEGKYIILGGNLRYEGCKANKDKDAPCIVIQESTTVDKKKEIVVKDNGAFGSWDYDALANEWDDLPLVDWGVPAWAPDNISDMNLTTKGREGEEGYDEFVDKFKQKLTTDDCYTPPEVYKIVKDFVNEKVASLEGREVIRPFFPGGDFEDLKQYPAGCVVLDNPPFSIFSKIVRFYLEHGIDFFLFGPQLTLASSPKDVCYIVADACVIYENGAVVRTGFITNMVHDIRIWVDSSIHKKLIDVQGTADELMKYKLPENVVTIARLGKLAARGRELKIRKNECEFIHDLDGMKDGGKGLYGGGFLLSRLAEERLEAEMAEAEMAEINIQLSPRELAIVDELDRLSTQEDKRP